MELLVADILAELRTHGSITSQGVDRIIAVHNRRFSGEVRHFAKKQVLPWLQNAAEDGTPRWQTAGFSEAEWKAVQPALRMKPRRTASGVATITCITKPWPCKGGCVFCPTVDGMPKSYLPDEPACQRALRNKFDAYDQVTARLSALHGMGHPTDKVELIVLGGTFADYPHAYQVDYVRGLFAALNDFGSASQTPFAEVDLATLQHTNETAAHRNVGLVVETRPDTITSEYLTHLRQLGCTKVQVGVQSLNEDTLARNGRPVTQAQIARAFELLRVFGFKSHAHFMCNLAGATPSADMADYYTFMHDARFMPDEVKLYPCALIEGTQLADMWRAGTWQPYSEEDLIEVLAADVATTPAWCRISRMIRDFSSGDIIAGNKKTNLRQLVDQKLTVEGTLVQEIRTREVGTADVNREALTLDVVPYATSNTNEYFLQWVTPQNRIAGFLRLSLPHVKWVAQHATELPVAHHEAMIREVHVYGRAAKLGEAPKAAQHAGLGTQLIEHACTIAREQGYTAINVISAVGTREYYRARGFADGSLYQQRSL